MENYSTTGNPSDPEFHKTGSPANVNASLDSTESGAPLPADPVASVAEEMLPGPETGALSEMSSDPASVVASSNPMDNNSDGCVKSRVLRISGIPEIGRDPKSFEIITWKPAYEIQEGFEESFREIFERAESVRVPVNAIPAPTGTTTYGSTDELFGRLQRAIETEACVSEQASCLLAHWALSTWFPDALTLAPGLVIFGSAYRGDTVLRTLRKYCRNPLMMTGITASDLKRINWRIPPTLLCYEPNLTKQMAAILGSAGTRGYMAGGSGNYLDFYCSRAVYLGDEVSADRIPWCSVQVNLPSTETPPRTSHGESKLTETEVQKLRNQLLKYRLKNLLRVHRSEFDANQFSLDTRAVANALGSCIVDSKELQSNLISLLTPVESQREADRSTSIEAVTLEATINLCHAGKQELLAGEVATEVNRLLMVRGDRLSYSAEKIGHSWKRVGLYTRRIGGAGRGLMMDLATQRRVHELAADYGCVGMGQEEKNRHCPICNENKPPM